ncbi:hypothetical protein AcW1_005450 [Taiwanofungus camphoratus]|nr:hypothetical protein AcW2_004215 [Antrodia cinnamomea]KAI0956874.1 hypothetical protein AcW1_005450 [Antrodia cinnamomea]
MEGKGGGDGDYLDGIQKTFTFTDREEEMIGLREGSGCVEDVEEKRGCGREKSRRGKERSPDHSRHPTQTTPAATAIHQYAALDRLRGSASP